jgi:hypothetical protein
MWCGYYNKKMRNCRFKEYLQTTQITKKAKHNQSMAVSSEKVNPIEKFT